MINLFISEMKTEIIKHQISCWKCHFIEMCTRMDCHWRLIENLKNIPFYTVDLQPRFSARAGSWGRKKKSIVIKFLFIFCNFYFGFFHSSAQYWINKCENMNISTSLWIPIWFFFLSRFINCARGRLQTSNLLTVTYFFFVSVVHCSLFSVIQSSIFFLFIYIWVQIALNLKRDGPNNQLMKLKWIKKKITIGKVSMLLRFDNPRKIAAKFEKKNRKLFQVTSLLLSIIFIIISSSNDIEFVVCNKSHVMVHWLNSSI